MFCPYCGNQISDSAKFCTGCGAAVKSSANAAPPPPHNDYRQPNYAAPGGYRVPIKKRNIAVSIILSIVTCGIYGIYWTICLVNELNTASCRDGDTSGGVVFLLSIVTCSIYMWYWLYKAGEKVNFVKQRNGTPSDGNSGVVYMLLGIFGLSIVSFCLIQSELNNVATIE